MNFILEDLGEMVADSALDKARSDKENNKNTAFWGFFRFAFICLIGSLIYYYVF
jgi:hypothetical protein